MAILFYTFRVFDKAPTRKKFNPTIGFSVYDKLRSLEPYLKAYYDNDERALQESEQYKDNLQLQQFFRNSMTFGPKCVIDEFYQIFHFALNKLRDGQQVTSEMCFEFINDHKIRYLNFENEILDFLEAKTAAIREALRQTIKAELTKLLEIIVHTLDCLNSHRKENQFVGLLQSEENMFERGVHSKGKKKVKRE